MKQFSIKMRGLARRLRADTGGMALPEFALAFPTLLLMGGYGLEVSNLANTNERLIQATMALADNMSRVGLESALAKTQIRESDVNDSFIGFKKQTDGFNVTSNGRIILSSLEQNASGGQTIHWQRCIGTKVVPSTYGVQGDGATGTSFPGMGPAGAVVTAPSDTPVMFVEVIYDYKPLFTPQLFMGPKTIKFHSSFIVRDKRDMTGPGIFNPNPVATSATCGTYTA
jgi:Flp pilus assembly protein TadG